MKLVMGIVAHVDAGKTTLSESLLYTCGAIKNIGRVDNKDAFLDTDSQEKERGITIFSKLARMNYESTEIILVDTPGHVDFSAEMERTLAILDMAVLVVSGLNGVQSHTKTLWRLLNRYHVPTIVFVNKMDMAARSGDELISQIKTELSDEIIDFSEFFSGDREAVYDEIATCSESLLEEYLQEGSIDERNILRAIEGRQLVPCLTGAALRCDGIDRVLDLINWYAEGIRTEHHNLQVNGEFGAYCYKISRDEKGVRLSHLKINAGSVKVKDFVGEEKINEIRLYSGSRCDLVTEARAGDIVCIPGLNDTLPGMCIGSTRPVPGASLEPVLSYAVRYPREVDNNMMLRYLRELEEELPELRVLYDEEHHEIRISLMGMVQSEIVARLMRERYAVPVTFDVGTISYKETITDTVEGVGHFEPLRHYAEVHLKLEPGEPGSGLVFDTDVSEDVLDRNWQRLIMTHLSERTHRGVLTGSPITDMRITVISGRAHPKHTEGGDFRQATYRAIRQGLMQAGGRLLEPYYEYTLEVPESMVGRAMTDIDRMNGTSVISENADGITVLIGRAPVATMHTYVTEVMAYTGGKGVLSLASGGYAPCHNEEEVLASKGYNPDFDMRNPSSSVFCEHGAGVIVPWDEVFGRMHVPSCMDGQKKENDFDSLRPLTAPKKSGEISIGTDEIDEIINRTAYANQKTEHKAHKGISAKRAQDKRYKSETVAPKEVVYKPSKGLPKYTLVDGYNVIFAWKELAELAASNIDGARGRLLDILDHYRSMTDDEIIVVFDAYKLKNHPTEYTDYNTIHVVYTRTAENADQYIERFTHEHGRKYDITVVTSDGLEQIIIRGQGCRLVSSREFEVLVEERTKELRDRYDW